MQVKCTIKFPLSKAAQRATLSDEDSVGKSPPRQGKDKGVKLEIEEAVKYPSYANEMLDKMREIMKQRKEAQL